MRAKSGGEGTGSTFIVSLPVSVVHTLDQSENLQRTKIERAGPLLHTVDLKGVKVIVVDDEADAIGLVKRIMEDCGATVEACTSGAECLACVPAFRPDVLITDIGMPEMDGYTLIGETAGDDARGRRSERPPSPSPPSPDPRTGGRRCWPGSTCTSPSRWSRGSWWRWSAGWREGAEGGGKAIGIRLNDPKYFRF